MDASQIKKEPRRGNPTRRLVWEQGGYTLFSSRRGRGEMGLLNIVLAFA